MGLRVQAFTDSLWQRDMRVRLLQELCVTVSNETCIELLHTVAAGKNNP